MMKKIVTAALAMAAFIAWSSSAFANGTPPVAVMKSMKSPGYPSLTTMKTAHRGALVARDETGNLGLTPISNNFTQYANSPYWGWFGYAVLGPQAGGAYGEQWLASAFTPKTNRIAKRIEVAALYYSGTNGVDLSLYDDASGLPGRALHTWHLTNLPSQACCTTVGGSDTNGISLTAGKQYWVVIKTNANQQTAAAVWGLTEFADVQKFGTSFAIYCGSSACTQLGFTPFTWHVQSNNLYGLAFSVFGK